MTSTDVARAVRAPFPVGSLAFVGIGPGDVRLLTLQAVEAISSADAIFLDSESSSALAHAHTACIVTTFDASMTSAARAKAMISQVKTGKKVVRLIPGDAVVDARIADELAHAMKQEISAEVLPGISPHAAVPAFAGIPLITPKSKEIRFIDTDDIKHDWSALLTSKVIVARGQKESVLDALKRLLAAGLDVVTPVAITVAGSTIEQQTLSGEAAQMAQLVKAVTAETEVVAVIGGAVDQRESWFESKPLFGWKVLLPRTKEIPGALEPVLRQYGATSVEVPTIGVEPPRTPQQMERAIRSLVTGRYEWVAFTSVNAVRAVWERIEEIGLDARALAGTKVAVVSEDVARAVRELGIRPDLQPTTDESTNGLLDAFPNFDRSYDPINRVFLPRADIATETLVAGLQQKGWETEDVTAYRTVRAAPPDVSIREAIKAGGYDAVLFTSSSTVRNLIGIAGKPHPLSVIACIGQATAKTAEEHGLRVDLIASEPDPAVLVRELAEHGQMLRLTALEAGESTWRPSKRKGRKKQA